MLNRSLVLGVADLNRSAQKMNLLLADIALQRIAGYADSLFLLCAGVWAFHFYPKKQARVESEVLSAELAEKKKNVRLVRNCGAGMIVLTIIQLAFRILWQR